MARATRLIDELYQSSKGSCAPPATDKLRKKRDRKRGKGLEDDADYVLYCIFPRINKHLKNFEYVSFFVVK